MSFDIGQIYEYNNHNEYKKIKYLGIKNCKVDQDNSGYQTVLDDNLDINNLHNIGRININNIKCTECFYFHNLSYGEEELNEFNDFVVIVSDKEELKKIKPYNPIDPYNLDSLPEFKTKLSEIEQSSIPILKDLFKKTYPNYPPDKNQNNTFHEYSNMIKAHEFRLNYRVKENEKTHIDSSSYHKFNLNLDLLMLLDTTPKADEDFYVFRKTYERAGYNPLKMIKREVSEENMFGSISTTILSKFSSDWTGKKSCCIYLIKVPKDQNYLIVDNVFNKNSTGELELNKDSQYEVALAPGKLIFRDINKINIDDTEVVLFICDYKSFTYDEFEDEFYGSIFKKKYVKKYPYIKKYPIEYK